MNKIKYILFDLDGTLVNTGPDLLEALNYTFKINNLRTINETYIGDLVGGGAAAMIEKGLKFSKKKVSKDELSILVRQFLEFYEANCSHKSRPYDEVEETLQILKSKEYKLIVCTNKKQFLANKVLKELDLEKYFDLILGSSKQLKLKPHTEMLEYCMNKMNVKSSETIMIGDSINDIAPSNLIGITSIFVEYGYGENENQKSTYSIRKFKNIIDIIKFKF